MKKLFKLLLGTVLLLLLGFGNKIYAEVNTVTPSTNDLNRTLSWAHADQISVGIGTTDLEFISTRSFYSCFEYRTDGDTTQKISEDNYNTAVTDGLYPYVCVNNSSSILTITANEYVEVRMVFGAERDERFDWTRFDVEVEPPVERSAQIVKPEEEEIVFNNLYLEAYLFDDDQDHIDWAVRKGTCNAGTNTVFGNVDGHSDTLNMDYNPDIYKYTYTGEFDVSNLEGGMYCFIFNPREDAGEAGIRLTRQFYIAQGLVNGGGQIIEEIGNRQKDFLKISLGGKIWDLGTEGYVGDLEINFHNVGNDDLDKTKFHTNDIRVINYFLPTGIIPTCTGALNLTAYGTWEGENGYKLILRAGDYYSPGQFNETSFDTLRIELYNPNGIKVYDSHSEFADESSCVGSARTGLDRGNLTISY